MARYALINTVLEHSNCSDDWEIAVMEWRIVDVEEDEDCESVCICGKEDIRYLYTIENIENGNTLFPIGSQCIKKFERDDFDDFVNITESMFKLLRAIRRNEYVSLTPEYFSRRLLIELYERGVFQPNEYNGYDGYNDYEFLLKMFNKRDKDHITIGQEKKIRGLIGYSIRPYLETILGGKTKGSKY